MEITLFGLTVVLILVTTVLANNECRFPSNWREGGSGGTYMWKVIDNADDIEYVTYKSDSYTHRQSNNPNVITGRYNCPEYQSIAGRQVYLGNNVGKQATGNGVCWEQARHYGVLITREGYTRSSVSACQTALQTVDIYKMFVPVTIDNSPGGGWTLRRTQPLPMPPGVYEVECQINNNIKCPTSSKATIYPDGSMFIYTGDNIHATHQNYPLTGTVWGVADMDATVLREPISNDRILILMWATNWQKDRMFFYCARYRHLSSGQWSLSLEIDNTNAIECERQATHDWDHTHHNNNKRKYFKMLFQYTGGSTKVPPITSPYSTAAPGTTTTSTTTTTTPPLTVYNLQTMVTTSYDTYDDDSSKANALRTQLTKSLADICGIDSSRVKRVILEKGPEGYTMATYQIEDGSPTVDSCKAAILTFIANNRDILFNNQQIQLKEKVVVWRDDSLCPDIRCTSGSACWVRQDDYVCECAASQRGTLGSCPGSVTEASGQPDTNHIITFSVVGVAALLVIIAIIVIIIFVKRRKAKDTASDQDSIGSLEEQDRDMYSSIGKRPTAFHDKSFVGDDDDTSDHGEKTGIHTSNYM